MTSHRPLPSHWIIRGLALVIIVLSLLAGWFQVRYGELKKEYDMIEDKYVRVRSELGREETQRLIEQSYFPEDDPR